MDRQKTYKYIKILFWIFLFLLLTEGIFRRWIFPEYSNIFLIARDPFVFLSVLLGMKAGLIRNGYARVMMFTGILCFLSALIFGHGNLYVALYGSRITILYFPYIYILAQVLTRQDVLKVGRIFVYMIIPMLILNLVQFHSPQNSFVNIGIGGDEEGAGFSGGARGYYRPPGIFTFILALTDYYGVSLCFLLYFYLNPKVAERLNIPRLITLLSIIAYIISIPVSISRTHLVQSVFIFLFFLVISINSRNIFKFTYIALLLFIITPLLLANTGLGLYYDVFMERFTGATNSEGGMGASIIERTFGWLFRAVENSPTMGFGDGHFSNFGMQMITGDMLHGYRGEIFKVIDSTEMEWGRIICENGIFLGGIVLAVRLSMTLSIFKKTWHALQYKSNTLAWLLAPMSIYMVATIQCKTAYNLSFMTVVTACCLSAIYHNEKE